MTVGALCLLTLTGCSVDMMRPAGPAAARIATLAWVLFGLGGAVFVGVVGLLIAGLVLRRHGEEQERPLRFTIPFVTWGGVALPAVTVLFLMSFTVYTLAHLTEPLEQEQDLVVDVIGQMWWWEVSYPQYDFVTATEIHIPAGQPVTIRLASADVIHSFWVPRLHGKQDLMPGTVTDWWIQADEPGVYEGHCAEFCGLQHTHMHFVVVAEEVDAFNAWVQSQQQPAAEPESEEAARGQEIFMNSACVGCHTIRGTQAAGTIGPDLTHMGSRLEIGAGALANTRGNMAAWVVDAQHIKPGNAMPAMPMPGDDLMALVTYLETLE